jgi:hypothetical protein
VQGDAEYDKMGFNWPDQGFLAGGITFWHQKSEWELVVGDREIITFENCQIGDWLGENGEKKKKVLNIVMEKRLVLSRIDNENLPDNSEAGWPEHGNDNYWGIVDRGFSFIQPEPKVQEMTLEQVCKALGKTVKIIK